MKNILVINVNWLGDVIFSSPVFHTLKNKYPEATLTCMAVPRVKDILESIESIDEIIIYDEKGKHSTPWGKLQLILQLRKKHFDIAFILHKSLTRALLTFLAGIPQRIGYNTKGRGRFLTQAIEFESKRHRSDHYLNVIESFGVNVLDRTNRISVDDKSKVEIDQLLIDHGLDHSNEFCVVNVGGNWDLKQWPIANYTLLINALHEKYKCRVVMAGAKKDLKLVEAICQKVKKSPIVLTGKTTLKQVIALMARAEFVISADSGPLHLANSVGTNVIGIFGPTRPELTGPKGKGQSIVVQKDVGCNRQACYFLECKDNICMQAVTVEEVCDAVESIRS